MSVSLGLLNQVNFKQKPRPKSGTRGISPAVPPWFPK